MLYPVISIRQPWAALILMQMKDVENRSWPLPAKYTGVPVLLHASKRPLCTPQALNCELHRRGMCTLPRLTGSLKLSGHLLGAVVFGACSANEGEPFSRWCDMKAAYWWRIQETAILPKPIPTAGHLGFWQYDLQEN